MKVERAIILAAGMSSRFAPLSYEKPKALITVRGEILIERQIRQLQTAGISSIYVVTGYKAEQFAYLQERFGVRLRYNPAYRSRNNHASIHAVKDVLENAYICSADQYFVQNPFQKMEEESFYAAVYAPGKTKEWCLQSDADGFIRHVQIGGNDAWIMMGHAFWSASFAVRFRSILEDEYDRIETRGKLWEAIYMEHLDSLPMKIRKYPAGMIHEFDSLEELRRFDTSYCADTRSPILKRIAAALAVEEKDIHVLRAKKDRRGAVSGFLFRVPTGIYAYRYRSGQIRKAGKEDERETD